MREKRSLHRQLKRISLAAALSTGLLISSTMTVEAKTFQDIHGAWYEKPIMELYEEDIISGYTTTHFKPYESVTRSQAAKILVQSMKVGKIDLSAKRTYPGFVDVRTDRWFAPYVKQLYEAGATDGFTKTTYRPDRVLTRAQMAKMMTEALQLEKGKGKVPTFYDVNPNKWYAPYIDTVASLGIAKGTTQGAFQPDKPISRSELAVMIHRALQLKKENNPIVEEKPTTDKKPTKPDKPVVEEKEPSKPVEQPSKPEKPVEDKPTVEDKPVVDEKPSKPSTPEKVVLKEVKVPFYDTYSKESELAIDGAVISLYSSKEDYLKGKKPLDVQKPKGSLQYKNRDTGFIFKNVEPGRYYYHSENKGLSIRAMYSHFYKDSEGYITIHSDGSVDGRIELERIHKIPHENDKDFLSPEKVKATKEYFIQRVNDYRKENNLKPLDFWSNPDIQDIADERAKHLEKHYGHDMPDGSAIRTFFASYNEEYRQTIDEAILRNAVNAEHAFQMWMRSPAHKNITMDTVDVSFWGVVYDNYAGIGVHQGKDGMTYFSMNVYKKTVYDPYLN